MPRVTRQLLADQRMDLRRGPYSRAFKAPELFDALISDTPFSEKTHAGHNAARQSDNANRKAISYAHFTPGDVRRFVKFWHPRVRGWFVIMTDHKLMPVWEDELAARGRYTFGGLPCVIPGMTVRQRGDGASREAVFLTGGYPSIVCSDCQDSNENPNPLVVAARPRTKEHASWGTVCGFYMHPRDGWSKVAGGKPLAMMEDIVRDYSRPRDRVVDPCAGWGTTLLAAARMGRIGIGSEVDATTWKGAHAALMKADTPTLTAYAAWRVLQEAEAAPAPPTIDLFPVTEPGASAP